MSDRNEFMLWRTCLTMVSRIRHQEKECGSMCSSFVLKDLQMYNLIYVDCERKCSGE